MHCSGRDCEGLIACFLSLCNAIACLIGAPLSCSGGRELSDFPQVAMVLAVLVRLAKDPRSSLEVH